MQKSALIVGAGSGISAAVARALHREGYGVALAARTTADLEGLARETGARAFSCDTAEPASVTRLFADVETAMGSPEMVLFNASYRARGPIAELDPAEVQRALMVGAYGGFLVGREAAARMLKRGSGAIFFTGASASMKGYAQSAPFAMAKFALRGLAQSMARELAPQGIHVAHFVIDGGVRSEITGRIEGAGQTPDSLLDPNAIAASYMHVLQQPRSAWTWELELRPWVEHF